jgi:hypothetical protein
MTVTPDDNVVIWSVVVIGCMVAAYYLARRMFRDR